MKKIALFLLAGILFSGGPALFAAETGQKTSGFKQILEIEKRGWINFFTFGGETVNVYKMDKKDHPKAWLAMYVPHLFANLTMRLASGIHDIGMLPWYAGIINDSTPLTRHFDMPDYVWEKE
jgi:hypothetical protein